MEIIQISLTILLILVIESVLSFDNIAVISLLVNKNLPVHERKKAVQYGLIGAFVMRGLCLFFVSWIINNPLYGAAFKAIGGFYLIRLCYKGLTPEKDSTEEGEVKWADKILKKLGIGAFWSTVIVVEMVDLVFSLDNLVAVVGMSNIFWVVVVGVFLGIITMRFVAMFFTTIMAKYPSLETSAFIVIGLLGLKLTLSGAADYFDALLSLKTLMEGHVFDFSFSGIMMLIFFTPLLFRKIAPNQH